MNKFFELIRPGFFPFILGIIFLIFSEVYYFLGLPSPVEILSTLDELFNKYGYSALFIATFVESVFVISFYFPGSLVILLSVFSARNSPELLPLITGVVFSGALLGMVIDYLIGYYGLHKVFSKFGGTESLMRAERWQNRWGSKAFYVFGFHPNFLSLLSAHAGIAKIPFRIIFIRVAISLAFWTPMAVISMYILVDKVDVTSSSQYIYVFLVFMLWGIALIFLDIIRSSSTDNK